MTCRIDNGITTPCNRSQGGIRKIYIANGPLDGIIELNGAAVTLYSDVDTTTPVSPWYTIELPRVTGTFDEVYEINQANGTVVYNQELRFVSNTHDTTTRQRLIELAESNDMIVIFEDNNGQRWLMGVDHGSYLSTATTETGIAYNERHGHTIVIAARNSDPAIPVYDGILGGPDPDTPIDPADMGNIRYFQIYGGMIEDASNIHNWQYWNCTQTAGGFGWEWGDTTGWQSPYDTVAAKYQSSEGYQTNPYPSWSANTGVFEGTDIPVIGQQLYYGPFPGWPLSGMKYYLTNKGTIWASDGNLYDNTTQDTNFKIVDFEDGVVTAVRNWSDYTCVAPTASAPTGYDPYYNAYYGYQDGATTVIWTDNTGTQTQADIKATIEAMPSTATPLYYRVLKHAGHAPKFNLVWAPAYEANWSEYQGPLWPFPIIGYQIWNYDTGLRGDLPVANGYVVNHGNIWDLDKPNINFMFEIETASGNLWCPDQASALQVAASGTRWV
jgi:hypothetical protein